jgi:hypothetical protein
MYSKHLSTTSSLFADVAYRHGSDVSLMCELVVVNLYVIAFLILIWMHAVDKSLGGN